MSHHAPGDPALHRAMLDPQHSRRPLGAAILFVVLFALVADATAQLRIADRGRWRGVRNGGPVGSGGYFDATRNLSVLPAETELREWDFGATSLSAPWGNPAYVALCEFPRSSPGAGLVWDEQFGTRLYVAGVFTQLVAPGQPAATNVACHRMAFDASNGDAVLMTLTQAATLRCWRFNGTAWRSMPTPPHFDPVFAFGGLVYDPVRRAVVALTDQGCWLFAATGTQWTSAPAPSGPPVTERALCWDDRRGRIVGFGGRTGPNQWVDDIIEWTGTQWISVSSVVRPTAASGGSMMFHRMLQVCVLFGGDSQFGPLDEVWAYSGSSWSSWSVSSISPQARYDAMLADDPRGAILFGGANGAGTPLNDTWLWSGESWQSLGGSAPGARFAGAMARLTANSLLLFGGVDGSAVLGDTWVLDAPPGAGWRQLQTGTAPTIRFNHAMAAGLGNSVYLFGGTDGTSRYGDFWTFDGSTGNWRQITASNAPPARDIHAMTFDSARRKLVLFGGRNAAGAALADTWEFDVTSGTWTQRTPATQPGQRVNHILVYDSVRQRTVLVGGYDWAGTFLSEIHEWDGVRWAQRTPATQGIPGAENMAGAFDSRTGRTVLFGGLYGFGGPVGNRTYELHEHVGKSALGQSHPIDLTITSQPVVGFGQAPLGVSVPSNAGLAVLLVDAGLATQPLFVGQPPLFCTAQEVLLQGALQLPLGGSPVATLQLTLPSSTGGRTISLQAATLRNSSCIDVTDAWFARVRGL